MSNAIKTHFSTRIWPQLLLAAQERAKRLGRTFTNYLEWLIREDLMKEKQETEL
jgi:hypothetical protein